MADLIDAYCRVWGIADATARRQALAAVWADDATYTDPGFGAAGAEDFVDHLGALLDENPGLTVERTSDVDSHHSYVRFAWKLVLTDGSTMIEGTDFVDLTPDGKMKRIVGFFGPLSS